jgi:hypothetical protein
MKNTNNPRSIRMAMALVALGATALIPAFADTIYRCGDSYSQQPCANGRVLTTDEGRGSIDARASRQAAQRDAALADTMEKARLKEEAKPANAYIPVATTRVEDGSAEDGKPVMSKGYKPHTFTAVAPREKKEKKEQSPKRNGEHKAKAAHKSDKTEMSVNSAKSTRKTTKLNKAA